jgi:hypothetical protein
MCSTMPSQKIRFKVEGNLIDLRFSLRKKKASMVVHTCNRSYSEGRSRRISCPEPAGGKVVRNLISKTK